jgi:hypothetical protein
MTIDTTVIFAHLRANWRTSLSGLIGLAIALVLAYTALPPKAGAAVVTLAMLRAANQFLMKDAGTTLATVAGQVAVVESHEVPNDPKAETIQ